MSRQPAKTRITRACRFCGEAEHLSLDEGGMERERVLDGKVIEFVWSDGQITNAEYVDLVCCQVCHAMAALDDWNGTRDPADYVALRDFDPPEQITQAAA